MYIIEFTVLWEDAVEEPVNARALSILSWQLMQSNMAGKQKFVQLKLAAGASWGDLSLNC